MKNCLILITFVLCAIQTVSSQNVSIKECETSMKTYPFGDPNPVAAPSSLYYPYFRFDGFANKAVDMEWKMVIMENDYIKLSLCPEIGGKIWGAIDKTTGKEFIYDNSVVKFRDIAMRGAWTSGGIEFNFGIIGHVPTSATPVDYLVKEKEDGSVSCYIFSYEWLTRTMWTVEVNLPKDKAYFSTHTTWHNQSSIDQPYYQWMNAAYSVGGNAEFCYPGNHQIGHGGEAYSFPIDKEGRNIGWYEKNNFGNSKSYHVLGHYNDFYGIYWHNEDFGSVHVSNFDEKLGMKIFLWGQSREGGIWEELLTDNDGQYIELQSGRMFNQPASNSSYTPYKQYSFAPQATDEWTEYWYPVKGIKGISKAGNIGALHVTRENGELVLAFSPNEALSTEIKIYNDDTLVEIIPLSTKVLEPVTIPAIQGKNILEGHLKVVIGDNLLVYSENSNDFELNRPLELPDKFDWNSSYGLYVQGEQYLNQKIWDKAEMLLKESIAKEPYFLPALVRLSSLYYREGRCDEALPLLNIALSLDTYHGEANYLYGLVNRSLHNIADAKAAFSIAAFDARVRTAAYEQLGELYAMENQWKKVIHYAKKSLEYNVHNLSAQQLLILAYRKNGEFEKAKEKINTVLESLPLCHGIRFEKHCLSDNVTDKSGEFSSLIRNELPFETYMELAEWYEGVGCVDEALKLLSYIEDYPLALYQSAYLWDKKGEKLKSESLLAKANSLSPDFVYPFRPKTLDYLSWAESKSDDWKIKYYQGLTYWANQQKDKALNLLNDCSPSDYAPFYLSRAQLQTGDKSLQDMLMAEKIEKSWRAGLALLNYYTAEENWRKVIEVGKVYSKLYPENYYIALKYAKGLCETQQYRACISLLEKVQVLPNEGSYAGREVYRNANLYQSMDMIKSKKYNSALKAISFSKEWPENLGVGKPYDDQIDGRLEDYLEYMAYSGIGNSSKAEECLNRILSYNIRNGSFESANLLSALAFRNKGQLEKANQMVNSWKQNYPSDKAVQWCIAIYNGNKEDATELLRTKDSNNEETPWEMTFRDRNSDLILRLFE